MERSFKSTLWREPQNEEDTGALKVDVLASADVYRGEVSEVEIEEVTADGNTIEITEEDRWQLESEAEEEFAGVVRPAWRDEPTDKQRDRLDSDLAEHD